MTHPVSTAIDGLPADPEALQSLVLAVVSERDAAIAARDAAVVERDTAIAERDALSVHNERLHAVLLKLRRMQFGQKSERLPEAQLALGLEDLETAVAQTEADAERGDPALRRAPTEKRQSGCAPRPSSAYRDSAGAH